MKMKNRFFSLLLATVMALTMLPGKVFAQDGAGMTERTTGLDLSGKTEAEANEAEGWSWSPDGEGGYILVLENVNISTQSGDAITLPNNVDVDIVLKGKNHISGDTALSGVELKGGLVTIKGESSDASLTAVSNENSMWGTISISNLLIESGNVYTEGAGNVIDAFTMTGGSFTIDQTFDFDGWAALHTVNRVSITGGKLEITTDESEGSYGIYNYPSQDEGESGVYIGGNAEVVINKSNAGIVVWEKGSGISDGRIEVAGGTVKINSTNIGMYTAMEDIILNGGNIEVTSDNIALRAVQGNINLTGSDVGIKAPTPTSAGGQVIGTFHDIHQWASEWSYDDNRHWKECTNSGCSARSEYAAHQGGSATCTDKAACEICTKEYGAVDVSNHTNLVKMEEKPATHMTVGNMEYWYCDGCKKYFSDETGMKEIALKDTVIPNLTAHTADNTGWHSNETNHWNTCECGETLNKAAHTFEWVIDKETTAAEAGKKHEKCTVCGYEKAAVEIPAMGTDVPQTGDSSHLFVWLMLAFLSGGAVLTLTLKGRKKTNQ